MEARVARAALAPQQGKAVCQECSVALVAQIVRRFHSIAHKREHLPLGCVRFALGEHRLRPRKRGERLVPPPQRLAADGFLVQ